MTRWALVAWCGSIFLGAPAVSGQTIQLPTFHYFTVATTVVVPDRGGMLVGGVDRASYGSSTFGVPGLGDVPGAGRLFKNRGIGSEIRTSRLFAGATIMDLDELDRAVLAEAEARRGAEATDPAVARKAAFLSRNIARSDKSLLVAPPAAAARGPNREPAPATRNVDTEAREAFRLAQEAEAQGHLATARVNYKRAALLAQGKLREEAQARLAAVSAPRDPSTSNKPQ